MLSEKLKKAIDELKHKIERVTIEHKLVRLAINEHCFELKSEIDVQTERFIKEANEARQELFDKIDNYERETWHAFQTDFDQNEFQKLLTEATSVKNKFESLEVTDSDETELTRRLQIVDECQEKLELEKLKLEIAKFGESILDYQSQVLCFDNNMLGSLTFKTRKNEHVTEELIENMNGVKYEFDVRKVISGQMMVEENLDFQILPDGNFIFSSCFANSFKLHIFSSDFKYCLKSKKFMKCFACSQKSRSEYQLSVFPAEKHIIAQFYDKWIKTSHFFVLDLKLNIVSEAIVDKDIQTVAVNDSILMFLLKRSCIDFHNWQLGFQSSLDVSDLVSYGAVDNGTWSEKVNMFSIASDRLLIRLFYENRFIMIRYEANRVLEHFTFSLDFTFSYIRSKSFIENTICFYQDLENKVCFMNALNGEWLYERKVNKNLNLCYFDSVAIPIEWTETKVYNRDVDYPIHTICVYNKDDFFL
jgi:hypothetical protein